MTSSFVAVEKKHTVKRLSQIRQRDSQTERSGQAETVKFK